VAPIPEVDGPGQSIRPAAKFKPAEAKPAEARPTATGQPRTAAPVAGSPQRPASAQAMAPAQAVALAPELEVPPIGRPVSIKNVRGSRSVPRGSDPTRSAPVLVRQMRGDVVESKHRGAIVEVGVDGAVRRALGDIETKVNLRSAVKPFGLVAFVEASGVKEFDLSSSELAIMAGSHSGEDLHVRTLQGILRRAGVSQLSLGCGSEGAPLDALTAARLARDGEKAGPLRHMCSGQHASILLLCKIHGWPLDDYWLSDHPVQRLYAETVARLFDTTSETLTISTDACGVPTYAFPLHQIARAFAMLADPLVIPTTDRRSSLAAALVQVRDAMLASPEMVAGSRDRLDTSVMKAAPGRILAKGGAEGLRGFALLPSDTAAASGLALKIEDGGGFERSTSAAAVEALAQVGALDPAALRALGRYHRPPSLDPRGEHVGEAIAQFDLAPMGELL
jgi:L-asparaginase II